MYLLGSKEPFNIPHDVKPDSHGTTLHEGKYIISLRCCVDWISFWATVSSKCMALPNYVKV